MAEEKKTEGDQNKAPACNGCVRWEQFQKNCHYYWDLKKECSMYAANPEEM